MGGASEAHNIIAGNLHAALHQHLRGSLCRVFMNDMKVWIEAVNHFFYPDLMVNCSERGDARNRYQIDDPKLIIEVLSKATAERDREYKRVVYRHLQSLQEYVLVSQDRQAVACYRRNKDGWILASYSGAETVRFESIDLSLPVSLIYEGL